MKKKTMKRIKILMRMKTKNLKLRTLHFLLQHLATERRPHLVWGIQV